MIAQLKQGDGNEHSKKEDSTRRNEILKSILLHLLIEKSSRLGFHSESVVVYVLSFQKISCINFLLRFYNFLTKVCTYKK